MDLNEIVEASFKERQRLAQEIWEGVLGIGIKNLTDRVLERVGRFGSVDSRIRRYREGFFLTPGHMEVADQFQMLGVTLDAVEKGPKGDLVKSLKSLYPHFVYPLPEGEYELKMDLFNRKVGKAIKYEAIFPLLDDINSEGRNKILGDLLSCKVYMSAVRCDVSKLKQGLQLLDWRSYRAVVGQIIDLHSSGDYAIKITDPEKRKAAIKRYGDRFII